MGGEPLSIDRRCAQLLRARSPMILVSHREGAEARPWGGAVPLPLRDGPSGPAGPAGRGQANAGAEPVPGAHLRRGELRRPELFAVQGGGGAPPEDAGGSREALIMPAVYARTAARRASTSSMIGAGTASRRFPFRAARSRTRGWSQRITPPVRVPAASSETAKPRRRGFAVSLDAAGTRTGGVIRCDQPRVLDLAARNGKRLEAVPAPIMDEVLARLAAVLA